MSDKLEDNIEALTKIIDELIKRIEKLEMQQPIQPQPLIQEPKEIHHHHYPAPERTPPFWQSPFVCGDVAPLVHPELQYNPLRDGTRTYV